MSSDWLRPVKQGGWRIACPDHGRGLVDVSWLGGGLYKGCVTVQWSFGGGLLTGWCIYTWTVWKYFIISKREFTTVSETSTECTASSRRSETLVAMICLGQTSAIATYCSKANRMRRSHDENGSIQMNMYSLGVMDLDLSISPDVFGLRAFDKAKACDVNAARFISM